MVMMQILTGRNCCPGRPCMIMQKLLSQSSYFSGGRHLFVKFSSHCQSPLIVVSHQTEKRPIIFVAHDLGGIVLKYVCCSTFDGLPVLLDNLVEGTHPGQVGLEGSSH